MCVWGGRPAPPAHDFPPAGRPAEKILKILLQQQYQQPDDDDDDDDDVDDDLFPFFPKKIVLFLILQKYYKRQYLQVPSGVKNFPYTPITAYNTPGFLLPFN